MNGQPIRVGEVYPLTTFMKQLSIGESALRSMREDGLQVRRVGSRSFILGSDFHRFIEQQAPLPSRIETSSKPSAGSGK